MAIKIGNKTGSVKVTDIEKDYTLDEMSTQTVPVGNIETNLTSISSHALKNRTQLTGFTGLNVTALPTGVFQGCTNLVQVNTPNVIDMPGDGNVFVNCSNLESIYLPLCTIYNNNAQSSFKNCTKLKNFTGPLMQRFGTGSFDNDTSLQFLALPGLSLMSGAIFQNTGLEAVEFERLDTFPFNTFKNSNKLETLILRKNSVIKLSNINAFDGTPFASNGSGGTIYVPESLIETYQSATN